MHTIAEAVHSRSTKERFAGGNIRGSVVRAHLDWVRDHRDRREVIEFFEALPSSMRSVVSVSWYPFRDLIAVDRTIMSSFGGGDLRFLEDVGVYAARLSLGGVYRQLRSSTVHEFLRRSALFRGESHDFGTATYESLGETGGRIVHQKQISFSPLHCATCTGFYREAIRLHGGTDIQVWESECACRGDGSCRFEVDWS